MRHFISFCRIMAWIVLIITTGIQIMAIYGIYLNHSADIFNPLLLIIATAVMFLAVVLFFALPRGKLFPLLVAAADAVFFVILACWLKDAFPTFVSKDDVETGITIWTAVWRHMSPVLVPLFLLPIWHEHHAAYQAIKIAESRENTPSYFDTLDASYKMNISEEPLPKPKRSVRYRLQKNTEETE